MRSAYWLVAVGMGAIVGGALLLPVAGPCTYAGDAGTKAAKGKAAPADQARHFESKIAPLLARHCLECHGTASKKGRLDLSRKETALAGGRSGKAILPGQAAKSLLWEQIESGEMPPKNRPRLTDPQKRLLRDWIDSGAAWSTDLIGPTFADERIEPHREFAWTDDVRDPGPILVRRLTVAEYIETVRGAVGIDIEKEARKMLPPDLRADGFSNTAYNLNVDLANVEAYARLAQIIVERMDVKAFAAQFSKRQDLNQANMRELISGMGKRLLRGPLKNHEIAAFLQVSTAVAKERGNFMEAVGYVVEAMLQSPRFLYRLEDQGGDGSTRPVNNHELASRLSYILWGGPPDRELMRAADAGELSDRGKVEAQVRRMLEDPRAIEKSSQFISEWLNLDQLSTLRPNEKHFPTWNDELAADMRAETLAFFKQVAWEEKRPLTDLLNAQVTFATPRLAQHYGLEPKHAVAGKGRDVPRQGPRRVAGGLQALYTFNEAGGDTVRDVSGAGEPIHLKIDNPSAIAWTGAPEASAPGGLAIKSATLIASAAPPKRLIEAVKKSRAFTLEAWITPANTSQAGPARIVTLSSDIGNRNFTLGQEGDRFEVRFRTTKTSANGQPDVGSAKGTVQTRRTHVVYTRDAGGTARLFIDGQRKGTRDIGGDPRNWDAGFRLALANELSKDRAWQGTLHLVAIYDRALSTDEVRTNHAAGTGQDEGPPTVADAAARAQRFKRDLLALYRFDEGSGDTVRDTSGAGAALDLKIDNPKAIAWSGAPGASASEGLTIKAPTLISSPAAPKRLIDALKKSKAVTLEAWVTPADAKQSGPARIVSLSLGANQRNFTLGQDGGKIDVRLRTTKTDVNGMPSLSSPGATVQTRPMQVVYTRDPAGKARLYIDGDEKAARDVGGDVANWDARFRLLLANESTKDRAWRGTYHLVAIYGRALTADEIRSKGESLTRYDLSKLPARGGLLTQGSVLTVGGDEASMVARGLFVLNDLLCSVVGDPPPCVDTTPIPTKPGLSNRGAALVRLADASCAGCHSKFEPLAFGLEKFDGIGAYHEKDEHGNRLRDDGEVHFPGQKKAIPYRTAAELMDLLAGSERVRQGFTLKVTQFALGRPLVKTDARLLDEIHKKAWEEGGTYASLIRAIVMSDLVRQTRTEKRR